MNRAALAKIHIARKELGLDEPQYRATLSRVTGRSSASDLSERQLEAVLDEMGRLGWTPKPSRRDGAQARTAGLSGPYARKLRALWLVAYNLDLISDASDGAIIAFVKRQTGLAHERWMRDGRDAAKVIEAIKAMLTRDGRVSWTEGHEIRERGLDPVRTAKLDVLRALFAMAAARGRTPAHLTLASLSDPTIPLADLDRASAQLGRAIRSARS